MPIPLDAKQVPLDKNRVQLSDGRVVTRHHALNLGAQYMGYKSHADYRKHSASDEKYLDRWLKSQQGKEVLAKEKELVKREGRRFNKAILKQRLIAARNMRTHPRTGTGGGSHFLDFLKRYGLISDVEYVRY